MTRFVWSSYWGTWSRLLATHFGQSSDTVELNLTPVNGVNGQWDKEVAPIVIRAHGTARGKKDAIATRLPSDWWRAIGEYVGGPLRHALFTLDALPMVDWDLYRAETSRRGGGGLSLMDCCKLEYADEIARLTTSAVLLKQALVA